MPWKRPWPRLPALDTEDNADGPNGKQAALEFQELLGVQPADERRHSCGVEGHQQCRAVPCKVPGNMMRLPSPAG